MEEEQRQADSKEVVRIKRTALINFRDKFVKPHLADLENAKLKDDMIKKFRKFKDDFKIEKYGFNLVEQNNKLIVDKLDWKGEAKKSGIQMGDIISNFKIENPDRPNKAIIYPFALTFLLFFGYLNCFQYLA